jgi:hypothetical protein
MFVPNKLVARRSIQLTTPPHSLGSKEIQGDPTLAAGAGTRTAGTIYANFVHIHCIFQVCGAIDVVLFVNSLCIPASASLCNFADPGMT